MALTLPNPTEWVNTRLLFEPMNWAIVFVIATVWLLAFHVIMQAFGAMQSTTQAAVGGAPGQVASPSTAVSLFSKPGILGTGSAVIPGLFTGDGSSPWTDDAEARFVGDGWMANP